MNSSNTIFLRCAGLRPLPFIRLHAAWRWGIGLGILAIYQVLLDRFWLADVMVAPHNGPWGALSWGPMLILATAVADLYHDERLSQRVYPLISAGLVIAGLALSVLVPLSKHRASASYVILSLGLSGLVFYGFHLLQEFYQFKVPLLTDWGRNPLILYVLHYFILAIYALPDIPAWYVEAPLWLVVVQLTTLIGILSLVGHYLNQHKLYFVL